MSMPSDSHIPPRGGTSAIAVAARDGATSSQRTSSPQVTSTRFSHPELAAIEPECSVLVSDRNDHAPHFADVGAAVDLVHVRLLSSLTSVG